MPHPLDDRSFVTRLDPKGMLGLFEGLADQCRQALEIAKAAEIAPLERTPSMAVLTGLGGSASGGDFVRALFEQHGACPFLVNRDYHLPSFVGLGDLVFCASYSGNTEETLSAYANAKRAVARVIVVTSGGKLEQLAREAKDTVILVPGGQPPRSALGFMMIPVIVACERLGLIRPQDFEAAFARLDAGKRSWSVDVPFESNEAKKLAAAMQERIPILYGLGPWQAAVANRWKCQINENAKRHAFSNGFPELNHNEILGWVGAERGLFTGVILEDGSESEKMKARARVTRELIGSGTPFATARAEGGELLERMLSLISLGDFASTYLAALEGVDPETIASIDTLKQELAKVGETTPA